MTRNNSLMILLAGVILAALILRAAVALWLGDRAEPISGAYDQVSYDMLAQRILAGKGFSFPVDWYPFTRANEPTAHWSFGYGLYIAAVYFIFGHHPLVARLIQVLFSGLNIWLAYRLSKRLFGEWAGLAAGAATAFYAYLIFFNAALMTQTFYILALLLILELSLVLVRKPTMWRWLFLGLAIGLGALLRQSVLLFVPFLMAWLAWGVWRRSRPEQSSSRIPLAKRTQWSVVFGIFLSVLAASAVILPWTVRNYLTYHDFLLLNSNSGYWFYASNHPNQGTVFNPDYAPPVPDSLKGLQEPALDRALLREGIGFVVADPVRFLLLSLNRVKDYYWLLPSEQSSSVSNLARLLSFPLYLPFMLYGVWLSRHQWRLCLPFYLYVTMDALLCLGSWSAPRYRLPSDAVLMPFTGLAMSTVAAKWRLPFASAAPAGFEKERLDNA